MSRMSYYREMSHRARQALQLDGQNAKQAPEQLATSAAVFQDKVHKEQAHQLDVTSNKLINVHALWRVIRYIYTESYSTEACPLSEPDYENPLLRHVALYAAANELDLDHLKEIAVAQFRSDCNYQLQCDDTSTKNFFDAIHGAFSITGGENTLAAATVAVITQNKSIFTKDAKFLDILHSLITKDAKFPDLLLGNPDLLSLIFRQWSSKTSKL
ncbi:hypothetical protein TSTA_107990 [Talaromyces stipitatus ATCC 10500]|uniref:BTB domain-containing protein n=1 Tax=Talaromyces stipitatus (strain ATCC 10500 / CBS 375.48 / QM 6759 / NRRL 1006) TaxID=441959 RepID=B8MUA4_TALSN|nr:uncharacterized protein TSTA_107990 [Talaromyces stipitatus ATCC 10500]EED11608.1 hypothetical protein TSTA_107990 [Talaromyces stipitatus ATCC 10500]